MRNRNSKTLALVVVASTVLIACNPLNKMVKRQGEVNYELTPNPVEMHGDSIAIALNGSFPEKYFNKKVSAVVTPVLIYGGNSESFDDLKLKGEVSEAEGTVIKYEPGGSFSHTAKIPYKAGMEDARIELKVIGEYKGKTKELDPRKVADGTIITPKLVMSSDKGIWGVDDFKKFTLEDNNVEIHYLVSSSSVRGSELNDSDIKRFKKILSIQFQEIPNIWLKFCQDNLKDMLQRSFNAVEKLLQLQYLSVRKDEKSPEVNGDVSWDKMLEICEISALGINDSMILNMFESTNIPFLVTTDFDVVYSGALSKNHQIILCPDRIYQDYKNNYFHVL